MPADASIFQNFLRAPKSVQDYDNEAMQAQSNALAMKTQQAQYNSLVQQQQQEDAIKNYLGGGANLATPEGQSGLYRVAGSKAGSILKDQSALAKDRAAADKDKTESGLKVWQSYRDQASMIRNPQEAAAWITTGYNDPVIGPYLQRTGSLEEGLSRIPQDQAGFESWRNGVGMNVDKLAAHALQQRQLAATIRGQDISAETTRRGQNMVDARAKEGNSLKAAEIQAGGKPPPGYRWKGDGTLEAIPGGPGDKLPESQQKQVVGTQNLSNAIQEYRDALKTFGPLDAVKPDQRATMGTKYNNMMLQAKEAYNLGVLNGPDFDILQSVVTDPRSIKGVITSNKALDTQAAELDRIMSGVAQTSSQLKPRGGATQTSGQAPKAGTIEDGHRFKGGNPADRNNWEKVK